MLFIALQNCLMLLADHKKKQSAWIPYFQGSTHSMLLFKINEQHLRKPAGISYKTQLQPEISNHFTLSQSASAPQAGKIPKSPIGPGLCGQKGREKGPVTDGSPHGHRAHEGFPEATSLSSGSAGKGLSTSGLHSQPVFMGRTVGSDTLGWRVPACLPADLKPPCCSSLQPPTAGLQLSLAAGWHGCLWPLHPPPHLYLAPTLTPTPSNKLCLQDNNNKKLTPEAWRCRGCCPGH